MAAYYDFSPAKPAPKWNEEVTPAHAGEDGPCWRVESMREMFIDDQAFTTLLRGGQMWSLYEFIDWIESDDTDIFIDED